MHSPAPQTGQERYRKAGMAIHLCIRNAREEQTRSRPIGTRSADTSCLKMPVAPSGLVVPSTWYRENDEDDEGRQTVSRSLPGAAYKPQTSRPAVTISRG